MRNNLQVDLHLILSAKTVLITKDKYGQIVVKCEKISPNKSIRIIAPLLINDTKQNRIR